MKGPTITAIGAIILAFSAEAAAAATHVYSYDPADAVTKEAAGPLTFEVHKGLIGPARAVNLRSTVAAADADLKPADARDLGLRGLRGIMGSARSDRRIYEIEPAQQGPELIAVLCPGAKRAWMAFTGFAFDQPLKIAVLGASATPAKVWLCRNLTYDFHGEWLSPPATPVLQDGDSLLGRSSGPQ